MSEVGMSMKAIARATVWCLLGLTMVALPTTGAEKVLRVEEKEISTPSGNGIKVVVRHQSFEGLFNNHDANNPPPGRRPLQIIQSLAQPHTFSVYRADETYSSAQVDEKVKSLGEAV